MKKKKSMFWNWIRWQCFNKEDWNFKEIPKGTMIDEDQFTTELIKFIYRKRK